MSKLFREWKPYGEELPIAFEEEIDGAGCAADTMGGTAPKLGQ